MDARQFNNLKSELAKIGIHNRRQLRDAIEALPPLCLYPMVGTLEGIKEPGARRGNA